jgi:hypothetical protein
MGRIGAMAQIRGKYRGARDKMSNECHFQYKFVLITSQMHIN